MRVDWVVQVTLIRREIVVAKEKENVAMFAIRLYNVSNDLPNK